jgi:hypothetical protein
MTATNTPQAPSNPLAQFDRIYDLYRDCVLNQEYYGDRLNLFSRIAFWLQMIIVIGSGTSGVSGWIIWTQYRDLAPLWAVIAGASTLFAALKPALQTDAKLKRYSKLFSAYRQLALSMKMVVDEVAENAGTSKDIEREVERVRARYRSLSVDDDPRPSPKLVSKLQTEINEKIPPASLFYPQLSAPPPIFEAPLSSIAGDVEGLDTKINPAGPWPHRKGETL